MFRNYKFWFKAGAWALIVTALLHSLSLIKAPTGENDTERQMLDLMMYYQLAGVGRTMYNFFYFFSLSMSMFTLFAAALNLLFARYYMPSAHARKWIGANLIFWTIYLIPLNLLTFIIPTTCYTVCWLFFLISYLYYRD